ncbi:TonB-dependent receptor [Dysgonomonas sp. 511]|uniref:TonB-dependent receptor n=1 Tax=Dysgonomonas sp. 511 TaxID=2302930 RepID=UPI0013D6BE1F|nr:TonB-dependent receptor [Dysgonomonas sp. 511]NDV80278.1 TonB-dependent receptor [Dysgonomonas sp. 511]
MRLLFAILFLLLATTANAQKNYVIRGKITNAENNDVLIGASAGVKELPQYGSFSDANGNYALTLPQGEYSFIIKLLGYNTKQVKIKLDKDQTLNIELSPDAVSLNEVEISAKRTDENVTSVQSGVDKLEVETTNKIPVLLGERDILKTIQLLPGVQTAGEGNTGFYVRGGSNDQNLILLDNAAVYNPSHLFGFFSTFNSDAVSDMTIYKGSMPAQYGGRLSSTLDISMRDGDLKDYHLTGGIGLISSRLTFEGPLQKERSSFILSARRTYADALAHLVGVEQIKDSKLYFYDLNAKLSYVLSDKDKLTFTAYYGKDKLGLTDIAMIDWGNTIGSLKWNHIFDAKKASATTLSYTDYTYNVSVDMTTGINIKSHIRDYNLNQEFSFYPNNRNAIKLGFSSMYHQVVPGDLTSKDPSRLEVTPYQRRNSWENAVFASNSMKLSDRFEVSYGLRLSSFSVLGGSDYYKLDENRNVTDTISTKSGKFVKTYWNLEPRLSAAFRLNETSSLKAAYSRTSQHMHLLSTSNMASPTDRWLTNTDYIKPEVANQVSLGYFRNFDNNMFEFSAEVYYKDLSNQIDFKDGADLYGKELIETELLFGKGRAYGLELFLKKKFGRFNGWIGYTLSRSERQIDGINGGKWYAANQDRRHDLSVVGIYDLSRKWTLSATWVYASGNPMTFPTGKYMVDGHTVYYYDGRNQYRAPAYHRLDLGAICTLKKTKRYTSELAFGLYNTYARKNPYMFEFRQDKNNGFKSESVMIYLFSVIPSVSWNFKF